jgi:hypothetical protein
MLNSLRPFFRGNTSTPWTQRISIPYETTIKSCYFFKSIKGMSYCTAPLRTTPEAKNGRSNSFVTNTSQSPKGRYPTRQAPQQRFIHPSDPTINFNIPPFPQSSKNANSKQLPPSLFESN